jgi:two-component system, sensor histidine kinase LadS
MVRHKFVFFFSVLLLALISCDKKIQEEHATYFLFEDSTASLTAQQAWSNFRAQKFTRQSRQSFNPGFTTSIYWLVVETDTTRNGSKLLEIGQAQINEILFHEVNGEKPLLKFTTGDHKPFSARPLSSLNFTFPLSKMSRITY